MNVKVETLTSAEVAVRSGCSYRQIDYWARGGLLDDYIVVPAKGSGSRRAFAVSVVPRLIILNELTKSMGTTQSNGSLIPMEVHARILQNFDDGFLRLSPNVVLTWAVDPLVDES
jgi:hypothetical protein